jgi:hypothetical protein
MGQLSGCGFLVVNGSAKARTLSIGMLRKKDTRVTIL